MATLTRMFWFLALIFPAGMAVGADLAEGVLTATGAGIADGSRYPTSTQAKLLSRRAAMVDAQRNLLETINGVRITGGTTVENMMVTSDKVGSRVQGMIRGAFIVSENSYEDAGNWVTELELGICVNGTPESCKGKSTLTQAVRDELPVPAPEAVYAPAPEDVPATLAAPGKAATGLIVDVSAFDFSPMLDVRIRTTEGQELYGPGIAQPEAGDWLNWARTVASARDMGDIVGAAPLLVDAAELGDDGHIVVSNENAMEIFMQNTQGGNFLKQGKVVFVVR